MKISKIIKTLIIINVISTVLIGCSNSNTSAQEDKIASLTSQSRTVTIENKDTIEDYILGIITTGESDKFNLDSQDIIKDAQIKQIYWFNGSVYTQVNDKYMYRFQLNEYNEIESCIKYELEE